MEALKIDIARNELKCQGLIRLNGTATYRNRVTLHSKPKLDKCLDLLHKQIHEHEQSARIQESIMRSALLESKYSDQYDEDKESRYFEVVPDVLVDRFNTLEFLGCMQASKRKTIMYSFHDKFAYFLAFLYKEKPEDILARLKKNCAKYNTNYELLSYAFCTKDIELIKSINLQCLVGVCDLLDLDIQDIFWYSNKSIYSICNTIVDISDTAFTPEERITTLLVTNIAYILHNLLNGIVKFFAQQVEPFATSRNCMLSSKGFSNVVITFDDRREFPSIDISLGDTCFTVSPVTYLDLGGHI